MTTDIAEIISQYPLLSQFFGSAFIEEQKENGLRNFILRRLFENESDLTLKHLPTLEKRLKNLASISGYNKLGAILKGASDWDEYQNILSQIDITLWFNRRYLLVEIEPKCPDSDNSADMLLSFNPYYIYCEVTSLQSILKELQSRTKDYEARIQKLQKSMPWESRVGLDHHLKGDRAARRLLEKSNHQLPLNYPGILAVDTTKASMIEIDMRQVAQRVFSQRKHVMLFGLWSGESGSGINKENFDDPTVFWINGKSNFKAIGEKFLDSLGINGETIVG